MSGQQFQAGDLVSVTMTGVHIHSTALGRLVLRLPSGTLVTLPPEEPGVHIRLAGDLGTPGDGGTAEGGLVPPARPTTTASPVDGGPGTPTWMTNPAPPTGPLVQPPPMPLVATGVADYARIGRRS
jgi:hypothetical protein